MGVTNRLVFDPTDADSIAASSSIGAFVRSSDGTLIDHHTIAAAEWLNVTSAMFDGSGTALTSTGGALDVVATATDLDIRDLTHVSDSVKIGDGTDFLAVETDGSINVNTTQAGFAAIENTTKAVSTAAIDIVTSGLALRKEMWLANEGNKSLYWGKTGVTTATGFPLHPGMQAQASIGIAITPQVIGGTGASAEDLRVMELA